MRCFSLLENNKKKKNIKESIQGGNLIYLEPKLPRK